MYEVTIKRTFSAAHVLEEVGGGCEELHGHNFTVDVSVTAKELNAQGLAVDFRVLKKWTDEILAELDHKYLNNMGYFKTSSPSSENIARFIYDKIEQKVRDKQYAIASVTVWESETSRVSYMAGHND